MTTTSNPQPSRDRIQPVPPVRPSTVRAAQSLTWIAAVAALSASAVGVLTDAAYQADQATESMLRGFDLTTLVVAVPSLMLVQRHPGRLALLRPGLLAYLLYSYLFAAAMGGFGAVFLLDVTVACSATLALVHTLATLSPASVDQRGRTGRRISAAVLFLLAVSLSGMWVTASLQAAATGNTPAGSALVEPPLAVRLGITFDLWLLVPLYVGAGVLLWRNQPWGVPLGLLAAVSGLLHQLSYVTAMLSQVHAGVPGAQAFDPLEPAIIVCYVLILVPLVRNKSGARGGTRPGGPR